MANIQKSSDGSKGNIYGIVAWVFLILWAVFYFIVTNSSSVNLIGIILTILPFVTLICSLAAIKERKTPANIILLLLSLLIFLKLATDLIFGLVLF
ncbi:MAG: hypothetical protein AAB881_01300 [Patescibacteria group bacterium]